MKSTQKRKNNKVQFYKRFLEHSDFLESLLNEG